MAAGNVLFFGGLTKPFISFSRCLLLIPSMFVFVLSNVAPLTCSSSGQDLSMLDNLIAKRNIQEVFTSVVSLTQSRKILLVKSRYSAGLVCQDKGWEFCARWAKSGRSPGSRIA
ncbi:hypothetical protein [Shewanella sp. 30m-9]